MENSATKDANIKNLVAVYKRAAEFIYLIVAVVRGENKNKALNKTVKYRYHFSKFKEGKNVR